MPDEKGLKFVGQDENGDARPIRVLEKNGSHILGVARMDENGYDFEKDEYIVRQTNTDTFKSFIIAENVTIPPSSEISNYTIVQDLPMRGKAFGIGMRLNQNADFRIRFLPRAGASADALSSQFVFFETENPTDRFTKTINFLNPDEGVIVTPAYHIEIRNNEESEIVIDRLIGWHIL